MDSLLGITTKLLMVVVLCSQAINSLPMSEPKTDGIGSEGSGDEEDQDLLFTGFRPGNFCYPAYPRDCSEVLQGCPSARDGVYIIQPEGYPDPFPVYCNRETLFGWTVIQRRVDNTMRFNRLWEDYSNGFGMTSGNHWLGNEKLFHLTQQKTYKLRIDMELSDGSSVYVSYNEFRIGNASTNYALTALGNFRIGGDGSFTQIFPCDLISEGSICPKGFLLEGQDCIPLRECACFWADEKTLIPNGQFLISADCTERRDCINNRLIRSEIACGRYSHCAVRDTKRGCYCDYGYVEREGQCSHARGCEDLYNAGYSTSGVYNVLPDNWNASPFKVYCDGGDMVIQRRIDGSLDFYRDWSSYKEGFGDINQEHWIGNEKLHYLTKQRSFDLVIRAKFRDGSQRYFFYESFKISSEADNYRLDFVDALHDVGPLIKGSQFSTYDRDNDGIGGVNCGEAYRGGWWFSPNSQYFPSSGCSGFAVNNNTICTLANLNGEYNGTNGENLFWLDPYEEYCNCHFVEMILGNYPLIMLASPVYFDAPDSWSL